MKEVPERIAFAWIAQHKAASNAHGPKRDRMLAAAADRMERGLYLLGATAIEDRLQAGATGAIDSLRRAGCRLWMLTGDKRETAVNVAMASKLTTPETVLFAVDGTTAEECMDQIAHIRAELRAKRRWKPGTVHEDLGVVIHGSALQQIMGGPAIEDQDAEDEVGLASVGYSSVKGFQQDSESQSLARVSSDLSN